MRGPVGLTAVRSVETALATRWRRSREVLAGGGRLRVPTEPVRHEATGRDLDPRTPSSSGSARSCSATPTPTTPASPRC